MDRDGRLRRALAAFGGGVWELVDAVLDSAARDRPDELRARRDGIVERLYAAGGGGCRNCGATASPSPVVEGEEDDEAAPEEDGIEIKILAIKDFLEDQDQSEEDLLSLLQNLADMDITYKALQETDIGRHVNGLRKHPSGEVRLLVKQLIRKWKEIVDDWVRLHNSSGDGSNPIITDGDSPEKIQGKNQQSTQVSEFKYSPSPHRHYNSSSERVNNGIASIAATKHRPSPVPVHHNARQINSTHHSSTSSSAPARVVKEQKDSPLDIEKLDSARKRLQENYQEAQNAKKQRTIQVMDINEIPKPKNRNALVRKGNGGGFPARHRATLRLPAVVAFDSLKDLTLGFITLADGIGRRHLGNLLSSTSCPCLQKLRLMEIDGMEALRLNAGELLEFSLSVRSSMFGIGPSMYLLEVNTPKLRVLRAGGWHIGEITFSAPMLEDVRFTFRHLNSIKLLSVSELTHVRSLKGIELKTERPHIHGYRPNDSTIRLMRQCTSVECVSVSLQFAQWHYARGLEEVYIIKDIPPLSYVTSLSIEAFPHSFPQDKHDIIAAISCLLTQCSSLRYLELKPIFALKKDGGDQTISKEHINIKLPNLQVIVISGFGGRLDEASVIEWLHATAPSLRRINLNFVSSKGARRNSESCYLKSPLLRLAIVLTVICA
uniref:TFIIS N-terminal domain-containing protein n=1 Tax=Leersia perrieri TaxID=77586 RepID=A0A0D9XPG3_9ORYZ